VTRKGTEVDYALRPTVNRGPFVGSGGHSRDSVTEDLPGKHTVWRGIEPDMYGMGRVLSQGTYQRRIERMDWKD